MNRFSTVIAFLQALVENSFIGFLSENLKNDIMQAIVFLQTEGKVAVIRQLNKLKFIALVATDAVAEFETALFFKTGNIALPGGGETTIWMSDEFKEKVLAHASKKVLHAGGTTDKFQLSENMLDSQIGYELGSPMPYSIPDFMGLIAAMISKQPKGEAGALLANGYSNIFYVRADDGRTLVVYVWWYVSRWKFHCYEFDENGKWNEGNCAFSPATSAAA